MVLGSMSKRLLSQSQRVSAAANVLLSFPLGRLGELLIWRPSGREAPLLSLQEATPFETKPPYNHAPFRPVQLASPPFSSLSSSFSSLSSMSLEQQPSTTSPTPAAKVSSLARRIHGWSWQAVRLFEDDESRSRWCPDAIFSLVPHRDGYRVSELSSHRTFPLLITPQEPST